LEQANNVYTFIYEITRILSTHESSAASFLLTVARGLSDFTFNKKVTGRIEILTTQPFTIKESAAPANTISCKVANTSMQLQSYSPFALTGTLPPQILSQAQQNETAPASEQFIFERYFGHLLSWKVNYFGSKSFYSK